VPLLFTVRYDTKLVLDTAIRFAFDRPSVAEPQRTLHIRPSDEISLTEKRAYRGRMIRPGCTIGRFGTAWMYKWAVWYGLAVKVGCLVRPGCTIELFGTAWLYKWAVWYGLAVQVGCLLTGFPE
jgi:hypothetical protein